MIEGFDHLSKTSFTKNFDQFISKSQMVMLLPKVVSISIISFRCQFTHIFAYIVDCLFAYNLFLFILVNIGWILFEDFFAVPTVKISCENCPRILSLSFGYCELSKLNRLSVLAFTFFSLREHFFISTRNIPLLLVFPFHLFAFREALSYCLPRSWALRHLCSADIPSTGQGFIAVRFLNFDAGMNILLRVCLSDYSQNL